MLLYVNGDSNSNGAEIKNLEHSWPAILAKRLNFKLVNEAKSGTSNPRILRTSSNTIAHSDKNTFVIIGWTSWEREEWLHHGQYYDVNAGGHDTLPQDLEERYKQWVIKQGPEEQSIKSQQMHQQIHRLHRSLLDRRIPHLFFNALMPFQHNLLDPTRLEWHKNYLDPYDNNLTYYRYLINLGFNPTKHNHHLESAQQAWADFLYDYITQKELV